MSQSNYQIRLADFSDLREISELLTHCWQNAYASFIDDRILSEISIHHQLERNRRMMDSGNMFWIAEERPSGLCGYINIGPSRLKDHPGKEIYALYVDPVWHRRGIGTQLLDQISQSRDRLIVQVFEQNAFKSFYLKKGFQKLATHREKIGEVIFNMELYQREPIPKVQSSLDWDRSNRIVPEE